MDRTTLSRDRRLLCPFRPLRLLRFGAAVALALAACEETAAPVVQVQLRIAGDERSDPLRNPGEPDRPASDVVLLSFDLRNAATGEVRTHEVPSDLSLSDTQDLGQLPVAPGAGWQLTIRGLDHYGYLWALGRSRPFEVPDTGSVVVPVLLGIADDFAATGRVVGGPGPFPSASALPDGGVLLLGAGGVVLHEPATGSLCGQDCLSGDVPGPRWQHASATLADGRVFIAGGLDPDGALLDDAFVFEPASRSFRRLALAGLPARAGSVAVPLGSSRVLLLGGRGAEEADGFEAVLVDPSAGTTSEAPGLPDSVTGLAAAVLPTGEVFACGGVGADGTPSAAAVVLAADGSALRRAGDLATPRGAHTATALPDGRVLVYGGVGAQGIALADPEAFVPALGRSGEFVAVVPAEGGLAPEPRAGHAAHALPGGDVLLVGGDEPAAGPPDPGRSTAALRFTPLGEVSGVYGGSFAHAGRSRARSGARTVSLPDGGVLVAGGVRDPLAPGAALPPSEDFVETLEVFVPCADEGHPCPR